MLDIVFLASEWNHEVIESLVHGTRLFLEKHQDARVFLVSAISGFEAPHLPWLTSFDGVVIQGNVAWPGPSRQAMATMLCARGIPAVNINYPPKHCINVGTNNARALHDLATHPTAAGQAYARSRAKTPP